eukprot:6190574-Pleurochrysis_carterae.AAC.3
MPACIPNLFYLISTAFSNRLHASQHRQDPSLQTRKYHGHTDFPCMQLPYAVADSCCILANDGSAGERVSVEERPLM